MSNETITKDMLIGTIVTKHPEVIHPHKRALACTAWAAPLPRCNPCTMLVLYTASPLMRY